MPTIIIIITISIMIIIVISSSNIGSSISTGVCCRLPPLFSRGMLRMVAIRMGFLSIITLVTTMIVDMTAVLLAYFLNRGRKHAEWPTRAIHDGAL